MYMFVQRSSILGTYALSTVALLTWLNAQNTHKRSAPGALWDNSSFYDDLYDHSTLRKRLTWQLHSTNC